MGSRLFLSSAIGQASQYCAVHGSKPKAALSLDGKGRKGPFSQKEQSCSKEEARLGTSSFLSNTQILLRASSP
ncbi:hypothetical protein DdX_14985 [Ditylenchus destructor]|uniref:Uncharacterized protein n=1 Tax=Ditylenchus destructor TaxID=166010 RepID=A0AAD4MR94_9BILA|nr:hypothetical protein DdX_14985 [Ditylenchus destructor]